MKTRKLLKMREAEKAKNAKIAPNWNVSGTREFRFPRSGSPKISERPCSRPYLHEQSPCICLRLFRQRQCLFVANAMCCPKHRERVNHVLGKSTIFLHEVRKALESVLSTNLFCHADLQAYASTWREPVPNSFAQNSPRLLTWAIKENRRIKRRSELQGRLAYVNVQS